MNDKRRPRLGQRRGTDGAEALDGGSSLVTARAFDSIYARRCRDRLIDRLDLESVAEPEAREWATTAFIGPGEAAELCRVLSRAREAGRPQFTILDLGCGTGGIGRYVAKRLDGEVWGVDFSQVALELARRRNGDSPKLVAADMGALPFPRSALHAAYSFDALYLARDKAQALRELGRVLSSGAPLAFTLYAETDRRGRACNAWRSALEDAGFEVRAWSDRSRQWRALMRRKHERRLAAASRLLAADGPEIGAELAVSRTMLGLNGAPAFLDRHRRLWVWAAKP
jgi:SAM-dependent methyltransferase